MHIKHTECPAGEVLGTTTVDVNTSISDCEQCSAGRYRSVGLGSCEECSVGRYSTTNNPNQCILCPEGADCSNPGTRFEDMVPLPGFFRPNRNSVQFYVCDPPSACVAGSVGECAEGYEGVACRSCEPQYFRNLQGECEVCGDSGVITVIAVTCTLGVVLLAALSVYIYKNHMKNHSSDHNRSQSERAINHRKSNPSTATPPDFAIARSQVITRALKNNVIMIQVLSRVSETYQVTLPPITASIFSFFGILNFNLIDNLPVDCTTGVSFYEEFIFVMILPIFLALMVFLSSLIAWSKSSSSFKSIWPSAVRAWVFLIFLVYNMISEVLSFVYFIRSCLSNLS